MWAVPPPARSPSLALVNPSPLHLCRTDTSCLPDKRTGITAIIGQPAYNYYRPPSYTEQPKYSYQSNYRSPTYNGEQSEFSDELAKEAFKHGASNVLERQTDQDRNTRAKRRSVLDAPAAAYSEDSWAAELGARGATLEATEGAAAAAGGAEALGGAAAAAEGEGLMDLILELL